MSESPHDFAGLHDAQRTCQPCYTCPTCGMVSFNPNDIRERYCGACHQFEDEQPNPRTNPKGVSLASWPNPPAQSEIRTDTTSPAPQASAIAATQES